MLGFMPIAFVLGAKAAEKGLSVLEVTLMTGINFAGGSEFAAVELWSDTPNILLIAPITLLINSRHLLMSATLAPLIRHLPMKKAVPALFLMTDEAWALGMTDAQQRKAKGISPFSFPFYITAAASLYVTWVSSATCGALIGSMVTDLDSWGLDMALPAVFLVILRGMWQGAQAARPWLVSLVVAATTYLLIPGAWYLLSGALSGVIAAYYWGDDND